MFAHIRKAAILGGVSLITGLSAQTPLPPVLEMAGPAALGVYQGAGCSGVERLPQFVKWLGRAPDQVLDFLSWEILNEGSDWAVKCWARNGYKQVVFSLPMLPATGATLADGAAGKFDHLYRRYAEILVRHGYGNSIIRLGWEFNGHWYPWQSGRDPQSWITYWRRIVTVMRATPKSNFRFDWNPNGGWTTHRAADAYPGDEYVDIIGLDHYNLAPRPGVTVQQQWEELVKAPHGLRWHRDFARAHNKPMSFPEWGTGEKPDGTGGGDDAYFVERMAQWIAANDVVYHSYWDYPSGYDARISDGRHPKAGAAFRRAYGRAER